MKKIVLFAVIFLAAGIVCAQIPPASPPVCAGCNAKEGEPHKSWCPYAPHEEPAPEEEQESPAAPTSPTNPTAPPPPPPATHYTAPASAPTATYHEPEFSTLIHPKVQPRPLFSGINEHNLTVAPTELTSHTQWGEVDLKRIGAFTYDICRYTNSSNTAVVLGHTLPNGKIEWKMLRKFPYGYYNENEFLDPEKNGVTITNIHIEAEGRFIFVDYSDGTNRVFDSRGNIILIHKNSEIKLLDFQYGDTNFFEIFDREASKYILYTVNNREENIISTSQQKFEYLDNAFISYDSYSTTIRDYNGNMLTIEKEGQKKMFFDNVTVYKDDTGYHYVVEVDAKYAIITSDLKQFGSWYSTMGELQRAWIGR